jgi:hypothetical protein
VQIERTTPATLVTLVVFVLLLGAFGSLLISLGRRQRLRS